MPGPDDEIPEFLRKQLEQSPEQQAEQKAHDDFKKKLADRLGLGPVDDEKHKINQKKIDEYEKRLDAAMKPGQRGIINPDFKPVTSEELLKKELSAEQKFAWKKMCQPRPIPALGWHCGDAYKLYKYQSEETGFVEWIWNSRDGVTPFTMIGKDGTRATHVDFHEDLYCPNYVPAVGTRIWADKPDFDPKKDQFNLRIVEVDLVLHNMFRHQASFRPWKPELIRRN